MRVTDAVQAVAPSATSEDVPVECELYLNGQPTGKRVKGAVLEAAIDTSNGFLLFLTDDCPFEDLLRIYLLDKNLEAIDSARIGGRYTTGNFSLIALTEPAKVIFRFIGDTDWLLELLAAPKLRVPGLSEPAGVHRDFGFERHFIVRGDPKSAA